MEQHLQVELQKRLKQKGWDIATLAKHANLPRKRCEQFLQGESDPTLLEFICLSMALQWDVNEVLELKEHSMEDLYLDDELQKEVIRIARRIPQKRRADFLQALKYLADCFR